MCIPRQLDVQLYNTGWKGKKEWERLAFQCTTLSHKSQIKSQSPHSYIPSGIPELESHTYRNMSLYYAFYTGGTCRLRHMVNACTCTCTVYIFIMSIIDIRCIMNMWCNATVMYIAMYSAALPLHLHCSVCAPRVLHFSALICNVDWMCYFSYQRIKPYYKFHGH